MDFSSANWLLVIARIYDIHFHAVSWSTLFIEELVATLTLWPKIK